ncbi:MAG: hypothetical protein H7067_02670 [Burkholderiales bacterium]|nr:hypothetical protein [Opitutaceae bacterium]
MPRILYIGQAPAEGTGSPVIVLRHLRRLAASGWEVTVVAERGATSAACQREGWPLLSLITCRPWWPPFRHGIAFSRSIRTWLLAGECQRLIGPRRPDAVLTHLAAHDDFLPEVAVRHASRHRVPLTMFIHDEAAAFTADHGEKKRLRHRHHHFLRVAHRRWFATRELAAAYGYDIPPREVLPPIPSGWPAFVDWRPSFPDRPLVYYAGYVWPAQFALLRVLARTIAESGATLVLLTRHTPQLAEFLRENPIEHVAPFATNQEVLEHLAAHAAGLLVSYSATIAEMPWIATSFPSKLIEQCHLGLPCAIVAPATSAVGRWARQTGYPDCFAPGEQTRLAAWTRDLLAAPTWRQRAAPVRRLAAAEFDPEKIQTAFANALLRS